MTGGPTAPVAAVKALDKPHEGSNIIRSPPSRAVSCFLFFRGILAQCSPNSGWHMIISLHQSGEAGAARYVYALLLDRAAFAAAAVVIAMIVMIVATVAMMVAMMIGMRVAITGIIAGCYFRYDSYNTI